MLDQITALHNTINEAVLPADCPLWEDMLANFPGDAVFTAPES